jgi:hypothetical protein
MVVMVVQCLLCRVDLMHAQITDGGSMPRGLRTGPSQWQWINLVELNLAKIKNQGDTNFKKNSI